MASTSSAERQRRHRERLKNEGRYEEYKIRHRDISRKSRETRKRKEMALPEEIRNQVQEKRRMAIRRRVAKYRKLKKEAELLKKSSNQLQSQPTTENEVRQSLQNMKYYVEGDFPEKTNHWGSRRRKQQYPQQFLPNEDSVAENSHDQSIICPEWTDYFLPPKTANSSMMR